MIKEVWRPIKGYEGLYEVSNLGRVKSCEILGKGIGKGAYRHSIILKPFLVSKSENYKGYRVSLCKDGIHRNYFIHILVAFAFPEICGEWFEGAEIHHIDFNPLNNNAYNLKLLTKSEHILVHRKEGKNVGEKNPFYGKHHTDSTKSRIIYKKRKPIYQYTLDGNFVCCWFSCTDCERETGMSKVSINRCCLGKQKQSYGYIWKYAKEVES